MELKFALRKSRHLNFLYYLVFENNALHRTVSAIVGDESHTVEERCMSIILNTLCSLSLSYNVNLKNCYIRKNSTFCKQHFKASQAQHQNIAGNYSSFFVFFPLIVFLLILPAASYM